MPRRSNEYKEEDAFRLALQELGIPAVGLGDYSTFRKFFHLGTMYGEHRMSADAQNARERLAEFIVKSEYVDRVLEAEMKTINAS